MMKVIATTKLGLRLKEFWLMTPKDYYELFGAWIRLNNPGEQPQQQSGIYYDVMPVGRDFL